MNASHSRKGTRWGRGVVLPAVLVAACTESPPDGDVAAPAVAVDVDDCADVSFRDEEAYRDEFVTRLGNWRLAYGRLCPVSSDALTGCFQLVDATPAEMFGCVRENADRDGDCPAEMRAALLDVVADRERAGACRTLHETLSREAVAAALAALDLPPEVDVDDISAVCLEDDPLDPEAAARCAAAEAEGWLVTLERERVLFEVFDAAVSAANLEPPPSADRMRWLREDCTVFKPSVEAVADCTTATLAALAAQREALAPLPEELHEYTVTHCLAAGARWRADISTPACLREDAAAYAEIAADYPGHLGGCGDARRYTDILDCAKASWLTPERIAAAKAGIFERHLARTEPEPVRDAIVRDCGRGADAASFARGRDTFLPGEHPRDIVGHRIVPCVESQLAAFAAIRRFGGQTYAAAVDECFARPPLYVSQVYSWFAVAACLQRTARRAGDDAFADALRPCLRTRRKPDDFANCAGVPER